MRNQVLVDMANAYGADIDLAYAMKHFKGSFLYACIDKISKLATQPLPDSFEKDYRKQSYEAFKMDMKPVEGITTLLNKLDLPFCVASSGPEEKIRLNLSLTGLLPLFENKIFSCYSIQKWKPDPSVFLWAAETMGFQPQECLVIEDSVSGVLAAKHGGFDVFGFTAHDYNKELTPLAIKTFNRMDALLGML